jgi:hypothetical protein
MRERSSPDRAAREAASTLSLLAEAYRRIVTPTAEPARPNSPNSPKDGRTDDGSTR